MTNARNLAHRQIAGNIARMVQGTASYAFDKKSARSFDADGRMRVRDCVISVAEINPYYGKEIPRAADLGLAPNTVYDLYRDPAELERAVDSFNGLPLMIKHIAQTADEPRKEYIGGSVGNVRFVAGRLIADLLIWCKQAIEYIDSGALADLSSSYRYRADMTPVEVEGRSANGSMRDIEGNHVALVEDGRATGAHVADSAHSSPTGATNVDQNENNTGGNAELAKAVMLLGEQLEALKTDVAGIRSGAQVHANDADKPDDEDDKKAEDSDKEAPDDKKAEDSDKDDDDKSHAMDAKSVQALVDAAVKGERDRAKAVEQAKRDCRGDLGDMIAMDSADDIYMAALKQRGVDVAAIPAGTAHVAYQAINAAVRAAAPVRANDSRSANSNGDKPRFDTARIAVRG